MHFAVLRTQHAVGQGGFHTGWVATGGGAVAYVYDCGAEGGDGPQRRDEEIAWFCEHLRWHLHDRDSVRFGALFVSHLDRDHMNGVPQLVQQWRPDRVFLPYLAPAERLALILESFRGAGGIRDDWYLDLARDPAGWLRERGVENVYFVHGSAGAEPGGIEGPSDAPRDEPPRTQDEGAPPDFDTRGMAPAQASGPAGTTARHVYDRSPVTVALRGTRTRLGWILLMHVNRADPKLPRFERRIETFFRRRGTTTADALGDRNVLVELLDDAKSLRALERVYRAVWSGSGEKNNTSMSLYSGPNSELRGAAVTSTGPVHEYGHPWDCCEWYHAYRHHMLAPWMFDYGGPLQGAGWLMTGDAPLGKRRFRDAFLHHFKGVKSRVGTFILAHHGSRHSFDAELLDRLSIRRVVAAAGRRSRHDHPHPSVVLESLARTSSFVHVHEEPGSALVDLTLVDG